MIELVFQAVELNSAWYVPLFKEMNLLIKVSRINPKLVFEYLLIINLVYIYRCDKDHADTILGLAIFDTTREPDTKKSGLSLL
jgi:hypothetical protein